MSRSVSTTSETPGPPPSWLGDVGLGVQAWVGSEVAPDPADQPRPAREKRESRGPRTRRPDGEPRKPKPPIPADEVRGVAKGIILEQLALRARSRKELADKLAAKEIPDEVAVDLLDKFEAAGLIDDAEFARMWVQARQRTKGLARRALAQELRRKGIADEVAREALDGVEPAEEESSARELVQRKLRSMSRLDDVTKTRRLLGMLARKGYPSGLAMSVIRSELADMSESEL